MTQALEMSKVLVTEELLMRKTIMLRFRGGWGRGGGSQGINYLSNQLGDCTSMYIY